MKEAGRRDVNMTSGAGGAGANSAFMVKSVSQMQFVGPGNPLLEVERSLARSEPDSEFEMGTCNSRDGENGSEPEEV